MHVDLNVQKLWLDWLDGKTELPEAPVQVQTHVSDFSESELPSLQDAQAHQGLDW